MKHGTMSLKEVLKAEAEEIVLRRIEVGFDPSDRSSNSKQDTKDNSANARSKSSRREEDPETPSNSDESDSIVSSNGSAGRNGVAGNGTVRDVRHIKTVGLALSGGGIRSGSVSLGFLQSLYRHGILRASDQDQKNALAAK